MKIYLVGGAVRDKLLNLSVIDKDWVVVGATIQELLQQGYKQVGKDFPVFLHPKTKEEYALARTEQKSGKGYTGFICDFNPDITIEDDLARRDLTINAIAQTENGELIDPYNGLSDLKQKILRHVSPAFREDPLRVLRVARFAARFHRLGFRVAPETIALMEEMVLSGEINHLTTGRIWQETEKALKTADPQIYFSSLNTCGALPILFPAIAELFQTPVPNKINWSYGQQMLLALKACSLLTEDITCRFAMTCYLIHKANSADKEHDVEGLHTINQLCSQLKIPHRFRKVALLIYQNYNNVFAIKSLSAQDILHIFNNIDVWRHPIHLKQLIICSEADYRSCAYNEKMSFPQAHYLMQLYQSAKTIDPKVIIAQGYHKGTSIKNELDLRRTLAIEKAKYLLSCQ